MRKKVYLETSFFSFLYDKGTAPAIAARREWTEAWWNLHREKYELITGQAILVVLAQGQLPHRPTGADLTLTIPSTPTTEESADIVAVYLKLRLMPRFTVAVASHRHLPLSGCPPGIHAYATLRD